MAKPRLEATISAVTLNAGGAFPHAVNVPKYHGENLYLTTTSDGAKLTILISDSIALEPNPLTNGAQSADVTLKYGKTTLNWSIGAINYVPSIPPIPLVLKMRLTADLKTANLTIGDPAQRDSDDERVEFVLIQSVIPGDDSHRLEWIRNEIVVDHSSVRSTASVIGGASEVPVGGGIMGPMGLATP